MYCWIDECNKDNPPDDCFDFSVGVWCQHGNEECEHNRLQACVIKYFPEPAKYSVFMSCYENDGAYEEVRARSSG